MRNTFDTNCGVLVDKESNPVGRSLRASQHTVLQQISYNLETLFHTCLCSDCISSFPVKPLGLPKSARFRMSWKIPSFCPAHARDLSPTPRSGPMMTWDRSCCPDQKVLFEIALCCAELRSELRCFGTNRGHETASKNCEGFRDSRNLRSA